MATKKRGPVHPALRRQGVKVRVVPPEEIAAHPTGSLQASDYVAGDYLGQEWDELPQEVNGPAALRLAQAIIAYEETLSAAPGDRAQDGDGAEVLISSTMWDALVEYARRVLA